MSKVKYIKTKNNQIIVFPEYHTHSEFRNFEPISAGFISIGFDNDRQMNCTCYGESVSLKLKSVKEDSILAKRQILGYDY